MDEDFIRNVWIFDEIQFILMVYKQAKLLFEEKIWSEKNPRQLHQQPLYGD